MFHWNELCQSAFDELRRCLVSSPVLAYPDYSKCFVLDTDASDVGIGAVLSQPSEDGSERVIAYASRSLSRQEQRYCVTVENCWQWWSLHTILGHTYWVDSLL